MTYRIELPVRKIINAASGVDDAGCQQRFETCCSDRDIRTSGEVHLIFQSDIAAQNSAAVIAGYDNLFICSGDIVCTAYFAAFAILKEDFMTVCTVTFDKLEFYPHTDIEIVQHICCCAHLSGSRIFRYTDDPCGGYLNGVFRQFKKCTPVRMMDDLKTF